ncbi:MAG: 4-hydroxy-3-methylbut-2-enyl diphosphate reductase [Oligoflexia bacterium]|nr:4-hydroxy-3-methylbut-2-enyl diphosphate reductase [Oligoflexia bacterium]
MGRAFDIPIYYRSSIISTLKVARRTADARKRDLSPSILDLGPVRFKIARHFGFCFGVENAIEIAYRALAENPSKRVFLLSEMIHNPLVNDDLQSRGVRFLLSTQGEQLIPFEELRPDDIVIVPAFGTTRELFDRLANLGINPALYNATCPFVEKVWKRADQLGERGYSVVIHGKHYHEETRATFSHARQAAPALVIRDMQEAQLLARYIKGELPMDSFARDFLGRYSDGFNPVRDLKKIGVVNQTTMLAHETQAIADYLRQVMLSHYPSDKPEEHFADTRDTLCYATSENQDAIRALVSSGGDLALVVGGYNSSNTFHLAKLCSAGVRTYYIKDAHELLGPQHIRHYDIAHKQVVDSFGWLPSSDAPVDILVSAGASCPDAIVDEVLERVISFFAKTSALDLSLKQFVASLGVSA